MVKFISTLTQEAAREKAEEYYRSGQYLCSEAVFLVANKFLGHPAPDEMVRLASGFPVGMGTAGCACGALTGGVMALGLKFGRKTAGAAMPGMFEAAKELHDRFMLRRKSTCCRVLIKPFTFGSPEHLEQCIKITGEVASDVIELLSHEHSLESSRKNCWEVKQCGREPGGIHAQELGVCPAATALYADGVNDGKNGGRCYWVIAGTFCGGKMQGTFAKKFGNCQRCNFYQMVKQEQGGSFWLSATILDRIRTQHVPFEDGDGI